MKRRLIVTACLIILASPVIAATGRPIEQVSTDEIVVIGSRDQFRLSSKQLKRALKAYAKGRPAYAPRSRLYFEASPGKAGRNLENVALTLRSKTRSVPVVLDAANRFALPDLAGEDWELLANRRSDSLVITPLVMSPGTDEADRLLGDLRLQCDVMWAAMDVPFVLRAGFDAAGGCRSSRIGFYFNSRRAIADATVSDGGVVKPVSVMKTDRRSYRAPVSDKTMPNSARVRFNFS